VTGPRESDVSTRQQPFSRRKSSRRGGSLRPDTFQHADRLFSRRKENARTEHSGPTPGFNTPAAVQPPEASEITRGYTRAVSTRRQLFSRRKGASRIDLPRRRHAVSTRRRPFSRRKAGTPWTVERVRGPDTFQHADSLSGRQDAGWRSRSESLFQHVAPERGNRRRDRSGRGGFNTPTTRRSPEAEPKSGRGCRESERFDTPMAGDHRDVAQLGVLRFQHAGGLMHSKHASLVSTRRRPFSRRKLACKRQVVARSSFDTPTTIQPPDRSTLQPAPRFNTPTAVQRRRRRSRSERAGDAGRVSTRRPVGHESRARRHPEW
jgi:hypothetical protein